LTKIFYTGEQFPPEKDIPRLAEYKRGQRIYEGRHAEIYDRASSLLKETPFAPQLETLFIAVNVVDVLMTKPADLLIGEPPTYDSGKGKDSREQERLDSITEENDVNRLIYESTIGAGYRGDAWFKTYYAQRADFSETEALGLPAPEAPLEPIIENVPANLVFPELTTGSRKKFKAINIAWIDWVEEPGGRVIRWITGNAASYVPYLVVERHVPGYITYERYQLSEKSVNAEWGVPISTYTIGDQVTTGRESDVIETGTSQLLVHHAPYKTTDDSWRGESAVSKMESVLAAINDRLVQVDYILFRHSDPTAYGPDLDGVESASGQSIQWGGKYIPLNKDDVTPGYMVWNSQLEGAFRELDYLLGLVFLMAETPQWLFGTTITADKGGTGTSHTDGASIGMRMMPILKKVERIRAHMDRAIRDAIWTAMQLENFANKDVAGFIPYEPVYPTIEWRDGLPKDAKAEAETMQIRTGGKATLDVATAIKRMDAISDAQAAQIITQIDADEERTLGTVEATVFNE
jgi:hypothetical protein